MVTGPLIRGLEDLDLDATWEGSPWFQAGTYVLAIGLLAATFVLVDPIPAVLSGMLFATAAIIGHARLIKDLARKVEALEEELDQVREPEPAPEAEAQMSEA